MWTALLWSLATLTSAIFTGINFYAITEVQLLNDGHANIYDTVASLNHNIKYERAVWAANMCFVALSGDWLWFCLLALPAGLVVLYEAHTLTAEFDATRMFYDDYRKRKFWMALVKLAIGSLLLFVCIYKIVMFGVSTFIGSRMGKLRGTLGRAYKILN